MYMLIPRGNPPALQGTRPAFDNTGTLSDRPVTGHYLPDHPGTRAFQGPFAPFVRAGVQLRRSCWAFWLVLLITLGFCLFAGATHARPIPVILDTDIGDDIDDTWALATILFTDQQLDKLAPKIPFDKAHDGEKLLRLNHEKKRFLDGIKVFVCNLRAEMSRMLLNHYDREKELGLHCQ